LRTQFPPIISNPTPIHTRSGIITYYKTIKVPTKATVSSFLPIWTEAILNLNSFILTRRTKSPILAGIMTCIAEAANLSIWMWKILETNTVDVRKTFSKTLTDSSEGFCTFANNASCCSHPQLERKVFPGKVPAISDSIF
ncbi:MAG: hypothetical protein RL266_128, partial [Bacteroidota bacterium]